MKKYYHKILSLKLVKKSNQILSQIFYQKSVQKSDQILSQKSDQILSQKSDQILSQKSENKNLIY